MEAHDLDLSFWEKVKEDFICSGCNFLCYSSDAFYFAWYRERADIVHHARSFVDSIDTAQYGYGGIYVGTDVFLFSTEEISPLETDRQIRLDFLNYMIEKKS